MNDEATRPDLSIVIVNYKVRQLLLDCLKSIYATDGKTPLRFECIVIDNASGDGSAEAIRALYPQVRFTANPDNRYFSAGYTQGIQQAVGRYVLALNPDMLVEGDTLAQLVKQMDADPSIGAATTTMHSPNGELQRNGSRFVTFSYLLFQYTFLGKLLPHRLQRYRDWLWYADWDRTTPRDIDLLPGSCIIARREVWQAAGGFDDRMLLYFSDDYVSWMIQQKLGQRTVYLVSDGIIHYEGASTQGQARRTLPARHVRVYFHDLLVYTRLVFGRPAQVCLALMLAPTWIVQQLKSRS
jgi:N-acetylglucosaminyl-diphospho-decaprenol L-rhamnosyltransferase